MGTAHGTAAAVLVLLGATALSISTAPPAVAANVVVATGLGDVVSRGDGVVLSLREAFTDRQHRRRRHRDHARRRSALPAVRPVSTTATDEDANADGDLDHTRGPRAGDQRQRCRDPQSQSPASGFCTTCDVDELIELHDLLIAGGDLGGHPAVACLRGRRGRSSRSRSPTTPAGSRSRSAPSRVGHSVVTDSDFSDNRGGIRINHQLATITRQHFASTRPRRSRPNFSRSLTRHARPRERRGHRRHRRLDLRHRLGRARQRRRRHPQHRQLRNGLSAHRHEHHRRSATQRPAWTARTAPT